MLAKCANPLCEVPFRYLESGRLFRIESDPREGCSPAQPEYYWLCRSCATTMTLRLEGRSGVKVVSLREKVRDESEVVDSVVLDRQQGRVLNQIRIPGLRSGKRHKSAMGGQAA